jgi:hypothetical protein
MNPKRVTQFPHEMWGGMRQCGKIVEIGETEEMDICSHESPVEVQIHGGHHAACRRLNGHS